MPNTSFICHCLYKFRRSVAGISGGILFTGLTIVGEALYSDITGSSFKDNLHQTWYIPFIMSLAGITFGCCWAEKKAQQEVIFDRQAIELHSADPIYTALNTNTADQESERRQFGFSNKVFRF